MKKVFNFKNLIFVVIVTIIIGVVSVYTNYANKVNRKMYEANENKSTLSDLNAKVINENPNFIQIEANETSLVGSTYNEHILLYSSFETSTPKNDINSQNYTIYGNTSRKSSVKKTGSYSYYFSGDSNSRICINDSRFNFGLNDFTVEFWLYAQQQVTSYATAFMDNANSNFGLLIYDSVFSGNTSLCGKKESDSTWFRTDTNLKCKTNIWSKYTIMRENGIFYLYQDNICVAQNSSYQTMPVNLSSLSIGGTSVIGQTEIKGYIDDFTIYNIA